MVAAFDYCLFGRGGAAPSIDTAMHGLVDAEPRRPPPPGLRDRVRDRRRRRGADTRAASATASRGSRGGGPGFQLGLDIAAIQRGAPGRDRRGPRRPRDHRLGRHLRGVRGELARDHPHGRAVHRRARPARSVRRADRGLRATRRKRRAARAAALLPVVRGLASTDRPQVGHYTDSDVVLDFLAARRIRGWPRSGTSCPDHFLRTKVRPMVLDLPPTAPLEDAISPPARAPRGVPRRVPRLLRAPRDAGLARDARRRPGDRARAGRRACSASARTSRPRGSPASSTSTRST